MPFHNIKLPNFLEVFAIGSPWFSTSCVSCASGLELSQPDREYSLQKYIIKNCVLSNDQFTEFNSFFRARLGRHFSFRLRDRADCAVMRGLLATGQNGDERTEIPFFKLYADPASPYLRRITKLAEGTVKLYINNIETALELDYTQGIVKLQRPLNAGDRLSADFSFDVHVRFNCDSFEYQRRHDGAIELSNIELVEVAE